MKVFNSASKIVFLMMSLAMVLFTLAGIVEEKDFVMLASMAFTYYFTRDKGEVNKK